MNIVRVGSTVLALALVTAACGSGADDTTTTTSTTVVAAPQSSTTTTTSTTLPSTTSTTDEHLTATSTIVVVQQDLRALGYFDGVIDGIEGVETQAALKKFQSDEDLVADGRFGSKTDAALAPRLQADEEYVEHVQDTLIELEFYTGKADGTYGSGTKKAIKRLQKSCELEETGELDINTRLCLGGHI